MADECDVGWCATGGPCFCSLATKPAVVLISIISLVATVIDALFADRCECCAAREHVDSLRGLLRSLFQVANLLLIIASTIENPSLIQIYVWYTLGFIVLGFAVSILDVLLRMKHEDMWCIVDFLIEVAFFFVLSRCLPIVDMYRKQIDTGSITPTASKKSTISNK
ncbi:uncharacterized protein [Choristoneura fumiferana]|uniref:uncharacterized protein n=1 Tax=Choristoneura fumiferana TaxID=7141 RepID=UPI003D15E381